MEGTGRWSYEGQFVGAYGLGFGFPGFGVLYSRVTV